MWQVLSRGLDKQCRQDPHNACCPRAHGLQKGQTKKFGRVVSTAQGLWGYPGKGLEEEVLEPRDVEELVRQTQHVQRPRV